MKIQKIIANDKIYAIGRVIPRQPDSDEQMLITIKNNMGFEALIKNEQFYFLCNEITEAIFTEYPNEAVINTEINTQPDNS